LLHPPENLEERWWSKNVEEKSRTPGAKPAPGAPGTRKPQQAALKLLVIAKKNPKALLTA
jgi:hypothetical protein